MCDFIYNLWFIYREFHMMVMREKTQNTTKRKIFPVWLPSHLPVYEMEDDCFSVTEDTEKKSDLP